MIHNKEAGGRHITLGRPRRAQVRGNASMIRYGRRLIPNLQRGYRLRQDLGSMSVRCERFHAQMGARWYGARSHTRTLAKPGTAPPPMNHPRPKCSEIGGLEVFARLFGFLGTRPDVLRLGLSMAHALGTSFPERREAAPNTHWLKIHTENTLRTTGPSHS